MKVLIFSNYVEGRGMTLAVIHIRTFYSSERDPSPPCAEVGLLKNASALFGDEDVQPVFPEAKLTCKAASMPNAEASQNRRVSLTK